MALVLFGTTTPEDIGLARILIRVDSLFLLIVEEGLHGVVVGAMGLSGAVLVVDLVACTG